jgi:ATP-dependent DNA ligase
MPRETTVRRVPWYLGPDKEIRPEELDEYERAGGWLFQPKLDGMFCMIEVHAPHEGRPHLLKSRDARTAEITGSAAGDLPDLAMGIPEGTILVGELEAASEWATQQSERLGYRRVHLFDMPFMPGLGMEGDLRDFNTFVRYNTLRTLHERVIAPHPVLGLRLPLVPTFTDRFRERWDAIVAGGGEGCVLKRAESLYRTTRLDGKTDLWRRCKAQLTVDYVLMGFAMTPGGKAKTPQKTAKWGLFKDGELVECLQAGPPKEYLEDKYVGNLVCEFKGNVLFRSGSLRHARFVRVRTDKQPGECVLR